MPLLDKLTAEIIHSRHIVNSKTSNWKIYILWNAFIENLNLYAFLSINIIFKYAMKISVVPEHLLELQNLEWLYLK